MKNRLAIKNCIEIISAMYQLHEIDSIKKEELLSILKKNEVEEFLKRLKVDYPTYFNMVDDTIAEQFNM